MRSLAVIRLTECKGHGPETAARGQEKTDTNAPEGETLRRKIFTSIDSTIYWYMCYNLVQQ